MIGISSPSASSAALGLPGRRSTKKLPSRKRRGRISSSASEWIGSPSSFTRERHLRGVACGLDVDHLADVDAGDPDRSGLAQRGGVLERRGQRVALGRSMAASSCRRSRNPASSRTTMTRPHHAGCGPPVPAAPDARIKRRVAGARGPGWLVAPEESHHRSPLLSWEGSWPAVLMPWSPGTFPMTCWPTRYGSFPASHSIGLWLGAAVFGYGL